MNRLQVAMTVALCCSAVGVQAQPGGRSMGGMQMSASSVKPGTMIEPAKTFDAMLSSYEKEMMGVVKAMPADKFNFAPSAAIFVPGQKTQYEGVRTFGEMVAHVAQGHYRTAMMFSGLKPDVDLKAIAAMKDKDQLVAALEGSFAFAHKAMQTLTPQNAFESVRGDQTRASVAATLVAHGFDHYGQLVEYLRMNALIPPASMRPMRH